MAEKIITVIEQSLGSQGEIIQNYKVRDKETGQMRDIDIAILIKDSYRNIFYMIEVRNRKKPIGSPYVEQIIKKKDSVHADKAFIVSTSGFYKPALEKAKINSIGTLTFEDVDKVNWFEWLGCKHMDSYTWEILFYRNLDVNLNIPNEEINSIKFDYKLSQFRKKIFITTKNKKKLSLSQLVKAFLVQNPQLGNMMPKDNSIVTRKFQIHTTDEIQLITKKRNIPINFIIAEVDLQLNIGKSPLNAHVYRDLEKNKTIAQVITTTFSTSSGKKKIALTVPGEGEIGGKTISVNIFNIDDEDS